MNNNAVLIQQATGPFTPLLQLTEAHHRDYCLRHDIDYWCLYGVTSPRARERYGFHWEKIRLIQQALEAGYEYVIYLDVDCLIVSEDDLRDGCPTEALGFARHCGDWEKYLPDFVLYDHFNVGAIYVGAGGNVNEFLAEWLARDPEGHCWHEQHALNMLAKEWEELNDLDDLDGGIEGHLPFAQIDDRWNSTFNTNMAPNPAVLAWHGFGTIEDRYHAMSLVLNRRAASGGESANFAIGQQLEQDGKYAEAEQIYRAILRADADEPPVLQHLGSVLARQGKFGEALDTLQECVAFAPNDGDAWRQLGAVLATIGQHEEAGYACRRSVECSPKSPVALWNYGIWQLRDGQWHEGLLNYQWGFACGHRRYRTLSPEWNGQPIPGKTLFVWAEQGIGDTLLFVRYLEAARRISKAKRIVLEVQSPLVPLLSDCPLVDVVHKQTPDMSCPYQWDEHVSLMSLPRVLCENHPGELGLKPPYFFPVERRAVHADLSPLDTDQFKVGLVWKGHPGHANDRLRSMSADMFKPLGEVKGAQLFSLQKGADSFGGLNHWTDTAAVIDRLDLVITVDTAVAHLAGAMGRPVWVLLPLAPDWRWGIGSETTPWYPTARLFRQTAWNDWAEVMERVKVELGRLVK